jgi:hypothetical protein
MWHCKRDTLAITERREYRQGFTREFSLDGCFGSTQVEQLRNQKRKLPLGPARFPVRDTTATLLSLRCACPKKVLAQLSWVSGLLSSRTISLHRPRFLGLWGRKSATCRLLSR